MAEPIEMGLGIISSACFKHKFRWMLSIVSNSTVIGATDALPPTKSMRPNLTLKEVTAQHLTETIYFPSKPDWKPINITVYDIVLSSNPVFNWIKQVYNPQRGEWRPPADGKFITTASLILYEGCGDEVERWVFEDAWPQVVEFGDLDMSTNDIVYIDITLRYSRAYIVSSTTNTIPNDFNPNLA